MIDPLIPIIGFVVGFVIGMSGMGGGSLMTPLLILFLGIRPLFAVSTDLVYAALTKTVGAAQHYRQGTVSLTIAKYLAIGALPAALSGVVSMSYLNLSYGSSIDPFISTILALTLIAVAISLLIQTLLSRKVSQDMIDISLSSKMKLFICLLGAGVGFLVSITSIGSGVLLMPFLILLFPVSPSKLVGTGIFLAALLTALTGFLYFFAGNVDLSLVALLLIGSLPGVVLGSKLNHKAPAKPLKVAIALVLFITGLLLILRG